MAKLFTNINKAFLGVSLILGVGCAKDSVSEKARCDSPHLNILFVVLNDAELGEYSASYLGDRRDLTVIWDDAPMSVSVCESDGNAFTVAKSSVLYGKKVSRYVVVTKMYYDDDAAFVELMLFPTGKNGDFFLRNVGGWRIVQRKLWETK